MSTPYRLEIVTPERRVFAGEVTMAILRGSEGDLGILARHIPLVTAVVPGPVELRRPDGAVDYAAVSGGFLEVRGESVTLLARTAEMADEIDEARAAAAKARAEERLKNPGADVDVARAEEALRRATARLRTVALARGR
jgi:F-type H+-transporting ATPase subunit epsilon